ncbi:rod shape-determining protein MreD, partial [Pseudoflavonifractor phocaeensis]|nr:rod shape-determining protein MreD [Pseudoflavonifractor phocaeensis]
MTTQDFLIKWGVYGLALLPVWFCQAFVLNRLPFLPLTPMLLPLAAVCVAVLEG